MGTGLRPVRTRSTLCKSAFSRHQADANKPDVCGFTIEFGEEFVPPFVEMRRIIQEVGAAMTELCWIAATQTG